MELCQKFRNWEKKVEILRSASLEHSNMAVIIRNFINFRQRKNKLFGEKTRFGHYIGLTTTVFIHLCISIDSNYMKESGGVCQNVR